MISYNPAARFDIKAWDVEFLKTPTRTLMAHRPGVVDLNALS